MIICGDRRNLQKDKHHCNTPPIWALWQCGQTQSFPQWRHMKSHLEWSKKHPQTLIWWTSILSIMFEGNQLCSAPAEYCGVYYSCYGTVFISGTDWGTHQSRRKAQCTNIEIALMKTQSRAYRTSDWTDVSPSNRTMTQSTQQVWLIDNSVNILEWPSHSLGLNPIKYFWRNLKMCVCPHSAWPSLRDAEVRRRMADNCQMMMSKACSIILEMIWGCNWCQRCFNKVLSKGCESLCVITFFVF